MKICPKTRTIRRSTTIGSDMMDLLPSYDLAHIKKIFVNINEPVVVRLLGFHVNDKTYCELFMLTDADKRYCEGLKSQYVHFQIVKEGYPADESMFFLAFLPRIKTESELYQVVKEICDVIEWLEIKQTVNCIIFRFGHPKHNMENKTKWQKQLDRVIKETKYLYTIGKINGRIKDVYESKKRCLTISPAPLFESISVS